MRRKTAIFSWIIIVCFCLVSCSTISPVNLETSQNHTTTQQNPTVKVDVEETATTKTVLTTQGAVNEDITINSVKLDEVTKPKTKDNSKTTTTTKRTTNAPKDTGDTDKPENKNIVSILISCKTAVNKGILEQEGFEKFIKPDGIIYNNLSVKFNEGDSALDVLKDTLKKENIPLNLRRNYIVGIAGLNEKNKLCGPSSGWLYRVNLETPIQSSNQYKLKNGDKIEFLFTCEIGDIN